MGSTGSTGSTGSRIKTGLATTVALGMAGWAGLALPAAAEPGKGNGNGNGAASSNASAQGQQNSNGPKGNNGNHHGQGNGNGNSNGNGPKGNLGNQGNGPKGNQGNHDGQGNGPKGNHGNEGNGGSAGGPGGGAHGDPAGNNGTVKITPYLEDDGIPQNTPHVSCIFDIEWYGFDQGADIISTVEFSMQAPTSDVALTGTEPSQVFVGGDPASGAGTDSGLDGEATYTLGFNGEPHPKQGYHVKLTVHTPGSRGADTKHKVFWVQPCTTEAPTLAEGAVDEGLVAGQAVVDQQSEEEPPGVLGTQATVQGTTAGTGPADAAADVPTQVDAGAEGSLLSNVASSPLALLTMALGLLLAGAAVVARRRTS